MASFDRSAFALNEHSNCHVVNAANRARQQQFAMWMNFYEVITLFSHSADSTRSTFKRFFNDVTNTVNNDVTSKRRRKRFLESKDDQRAFFVNVFVFYQSTFFESVVVRSRQEIRRFARFANRVFFFSQLLFQEDDDDDDFDLLSFRSYTGLYDHDFDFAFDDETETISSSQQTKKRSTQRQRSNNIRESTRKIKSNDQIRVRSRVRKSESRNTRDDIKLNSDYFNARKLDLISISHVLSKLRMNENVCFFCKVYRYFEKRDKNFNKQY